MFLLAFIEDGCFFWRSLTMDVFLGWLMSTDVSVSPMFLLGAYVPAFLYRRILRVPFIGNCVSTGLFNDIFCDLRSLTSCFSNDID